MEFNTLSKMGLILAQSLTFSVQEVNLPAVRAFTGRVPVLETTENNMGEIYEFTVVAKTEDGFRDLHWLRGGIASLVKVD